MAQNRRIKGVGFQLIIRSGSVTEAVQKAIVEGLEDVGKQYKNQVKKTIGLQDHSLEDLRKMGHPYRVGGPEDSVHGDDRIVHRQSGTLYNSIKLQPVSQETSRRFTVYVSSDHPMLQGIIYGTPTMRPRRFHEKAYEDIKDKYWSPLMDALKKVNLRISGYEQ